MKRILFSAVFAIIFAREARASVSAYGIEGAVRITFLGDHESSLAAEVARIVASHAEANTIGLPQGGFEAHSPLGSVARLNQEVMATLILADNADLAGFAGDVGAQNYVTVSVQGATARIVAAIIGDNPTLEHVHCARALGKDFCSFTQLGALSE